MTITMLFATVQSEQAGRLAAAGATALEWAPSVALVLVLGSGVVLWLAGHKYLRGAFLLLGAAGCGWVGLAVVETLPELRADPLTAIGIGALLGALVGWLAYRLCIAGATGLILGVLAGTATIIAMDRPWDAPTGATDARAVEVTSAPSTSPADSPPDSPIDSPSDEPSFEARARDILDSWVDRAREFWNALPRRTRMASTLAALTGTLVGLCIGLGLHQRAAAVTTAIIGPAIAAPAALALAARSPVSVTDSLPERPLFWLIGWVAAALLGLIMQMWSMGRRVQPA